MTRILNIITGSNGGRPPCVPSEEASAAFSSGRNASNSTAASNASSGSPRSLNRFNRSSTSKNPACLRMESSPIHPSQGNQKGGELARFLGRIQLEGTSRCVDDVADKPEGEVAARRGCHAAKNDRSAVGNGSS